MSTLPEGSIKVDHVWKRFRADRAHPLLQDQVMALGRRVVRRQGAEWRWVLREINLHVRPGETVALVGLNGSGKSTLLKVISQVTYQTSGQCETSGRIGALLEVRSGIHPLLTGRENIFLYGAILGLKKKEIAKRFDRIVEFAEISDAVDRQVKYYSSGMQVRIGFAIAAFLDPAILLVDEVLAVGDASFQQKCLQRISEVVANGTTLIFVSHDLAAVEAMCDRTLWLSDSVVRADGPTRDALQHYRTLVEGQAALTAVDDGDATLVKVVVEGEGGGQVQSGRALTATVVVDIPESGRVAVFLGVSEGTAMPVFALRQTFEAAAGQVQIRCRMEHLPLPNGHYSLWLGMRPQGANIAVNPYVGWQPVTSFDVFGPLPTKPPGGVMVLSPVHVDASWELS